jgi:hypothetical protein
LNYPEYGCPKFSRQPRPRLDDLDKVGVEFAVRKTRFQQALNGFARKTAFLNEAEGTRTLNLRIDSPML